MINRRSSFISIILALLIVTYLGFQIPNISFDYKLENFFPMDDPDLDYYNEFSKKFGSDNDYVLIGIKSKKGIFNQAFTHQLKDLSKELKSLDETKQLISLTEARKVVKGPMGYMEFPYLHMENDSTLWQDSVRIQKEKHIRDQFFSKDMTSTKVLVIHETFDGKEEADAFANKLTIVLSQYDFKSTHQVGKIVAQKAFLAALESDFSTFLVLALIIVLIMLIIFLRNPVLIIAALGVSGLSLIATLGLMAATGKQIDALSTLIPSILLVVTMSDLIHLYAQVRIEIDKNPDMPFAINRAVRKVGWATLLTSITTAIGFITLITINVKPVIGLGIYSAAGIFLAFIITYLIFPQVLLLIKPQLKVRTSNRLFANYLKTTFHWILRKQPQIIVTFLVLLGIVVWGISQLKVNAYIVDDLPNNDPVKYDFMFFDEEFSGSKPFTMAVWSKDSTKNIYSKEVISELEKIKKLAVEELNAGDLISPVTYVKSVHQSLNGGQSEYFSLPKKDSDWKRIFREINRYDAENKFIKVTDNGIAQITGFSQDKGSHDAGVRREIFKEKIYQTVDMDLIDYRITGTTVLVNKSHEVLSFNLLKGLFIALLLVGIISGLMFRSLKMTLIALIPNLFPILSVAAIMGFFNIPINLSSSVIFAISFGIVVDDTIHFLSKLKMEKDRGLSDLYAIKRTLFSTGEPIIMTTIILTSGFVVFCLSEFNASIYIGLFVSISFIVAVFADLILLPVLILKFLPSKPLKAKMS